MIIISFQDALDKVVESSMKFKFTSKLTMDNSTMQWLQEKSTLIWNLASRDNINYVH